jgi:hypothetical protein
MLYYFVIYIFGRSLHVIAPTVLVLGVLSHLSVFHNRDCSMVLTAGVRQPKFRRRKLPMSPLTVFAYGSMGARCELLCRTGELHIQPTFSS